MPPLLVTPDNWFVAANVVSHVRFSVVDDGPVNETLAIIASSSDGNLVPNVNLVAAPDDPIVSGQPDDWILTVMPPTNYTGTSTLTLIVSNEVSMTSTTTVELTIAQPLPLNGQVLEGMNLSWLSGGAGQWFGQTNVTHDGVSAAQSGNVLDNEESWLETTVTGPGVLSFWWKVSSEPGYDWLELYANGVLQANVIFGERDWEQVTMSIPSGLQTLRWRYVKDWGWSYGFDAAWLDQVTYQSEANLNPLISFVSVTNGVVVIKWSATPGQVYRMQYKDELAADWSDLSPDVLATGSTATGSNIVDSVTQRFYRVSVVP
jgi:hypothetical protein